MALTGEQITLLTDKMLECDAYLDTLDDDIEVLTEKIEDLFNSLRDYAKAFKDNPTNYRYRIESYEEENLFTFTAFEGAEAKQSLIYNILNKYGITAIKITTPYNNRELILSQYGTAEEAKSDIMTDIENFLLYAEGGFLQLPPT